MILTFYIIGDYALSDKHVKKFFEKKQNVVNVIGQSNAEALLAVMIPYFEQHAEGILFLLLKMCSFSKYSFNNNNRSCH